MEDMSQTEAPVTIAEAINDFRSANAALRQIRKGGGSTAATTNAIARHQRVADRAVRALMEDRQRAIVGDLTEEQHLIERLDGDMEPTWHGVQVERLALARENVRRWSRVVGSYELQVS